MRFGIDKNNSVNLIDVGSKQIGKHFNLREQNMSLKNDDFGRTFERKRMESQPSKSTFRVSATNIKNVNVGTQNISKRINIKEAAGSPKYDEKMDKAAVEFNEEERNNSKELAKMSESSADKQAKLKKPEENKELDVKKAEETEEETTENIIMSSLISLLDQLNSVNEVIEDMETSFDKLTKDMSAQNSKNLQELLKEISTTIEEMKMKSDAGKIELTKDLGFNIEQFEEFEKLLENSEKLASSLKKISNLEKNSNLKDLKSMMESLNVENVELSKHSFKNAGDVAGEMNSENGLEKIQNRVEGVKESEIDEKTDNSSNSKNDFKNVIELKTDSENSVKVEFVEAQRSSVDQVLDNIQKNQNQIKSFLKTEIFEQVKVSIAKQSIKTADHSEMIIKLKPEDLGKVELKIEVHKDEVIAKFNVASQIVKEAIESNLSDLKNALKDKGFDVMNFGVDVGGSGKENSGNSSKRPDREISGVELEESAESVNQMYRMSLYAMEQGSSFEHLA